VVFHTAFFLLLINHSGNLFFKIVIMTVARIPPTMLIIYFTNSSILPKFFGSIVLRAEAVPAVAAVPRMKLID